MKKILIMSLVFLLFSISFVSAELFVNYADTINITDGTLFSGSIDDTKIFNDDYLSIQEVTGLNAMLFTISINTIGDVNELLLNARYRGGASHIVYLSVYDYNINDFVILKEYTNNPNFIYETFNLSEINTSNEVLLKFLHSDGGVDTHFFDIEYLVVTSDYEEVINDFSINLLELDLSDTLTIILITLFLITGIIISLFVDTLTGGAFISLIGLIILIGNLLIFGLLLIIIGVTLIFFDKPVLK
jgi:hypothetical protein